MSPNPVATAGGALLLVVAAVTLLLGGRKSEKMLRARVVSAGALVVSKQSDPQSAILDLPQERNHLVRAAEMLGYRTDLPPGYGASLKVVIPAVAIAAVVAAKLAGQVLGSVPTALAGVAAALLMARFLFVRSNNAYTAVLFRQIPDAMSHMLRAVRAGLPITEAIRSVGRESLSPTREEFNRVTGETALGLPIEIALQRLYMRTQLQEYAFFSVVIGLQGQTGGNLSEVLENLADMVRRRVAMAAKARALAAEGKMSAIVVSALPFVVGLLIFFVNPEYMDEFVTNPKGPMFIVAFAVLLGLGALSTQWLIKRSLQD